MRRLFTALLVPLLLACCDRRIVESPTPSSASATPVDLYTHHVRDLAGRDVDLADYRGRVVLVVNVASACGFTPQYEQLQQLQEDWSDQGVCVLAFPCNDFGGQEPGQPEAIRVTCDRYDVTFPVMAKVRIKSGDAQSPVYADLQRATGTLPRWNFGKYLIAADGRPVAFFGSSVEPMSPELQTALKQQVDLGR